MKPTKNINPVDVEIAKMLFNKEKSGKDTAISPISDDIMLYYNSVNIAVGKQGRGKSLLFLRELVKISKLNNPKFHLIIYVNQEGTNDETLNSIEPLINIPILKINYEDAEEVVAGIIDYKTFYYSLIEKGDYDIITPEQRQEVNIALNIQDDSIKQLHTLILFDDAAFNSLFKRSDSYFNKLVTRCRHINFIFMFAVQKFQGVSMPIKSQATSLYIYAGYTNHEISYIFNNSTVKGFNYSEFRELYKKIKEDEVLYCNSQSDQLKIIDLSHIRKMTTLMS